MIRPRARHIAGVAVAGIALTGAIGVTATTTAAPAAAAQVGLRIAQHNTDQKPARWAKVVALAESGNWDAVTAQEVCVGWKQDLEKKHSGWTIAYHGQVAKADCPGGFKGNVAIHPGSGSRFAEAFDVFGEDKEFGMACAIFDKGDRRVHACSTHFTVYATDPATVRNRQAKRVKEWTAQWTGRGHAVVVAGDLNTSSGSAELGPIYQYPAGRSNGAFVEAEQLRVRSGARVGRNTVQGRKIDYVFFSTNRTPLSAGGTLTLTSVKKKGAKKEPHKILKATTVLR